jgi:hypothetical protein
MRKGRCSRGECGASGEPETRDPRLGVVKRSLRTQTRTTLISGSTSLPEYRSDVYYGIVPMMLDGVMAIRQE